jgi:hypothetical protein
MRCRPLNAAAVQTATGTAKLCGASDATTRC